MSKAFSISFPVKSAEQVATQLGVSKARRDRIFTIVEKTLAKNGSHVKFSKGKSKGQGVKNTIRASRSGHRNNAKVKAPR